MESSSSHLFERLGGEIGIERLVGRFYERVQADEHLAPFFEHVPMERLQRMQKEYFSEAVGGPLDDTGRSLRQVHAGRGIRKEDLRRFTVHLVATLKEAETRASARRKPMRFTAGSRWRRTGSRMM